MSEGVGGDGAQARRSAEDQLLAGMLRALATVDDPSKTVQRTAEHLQQFFGTSIGIFLMDGNALRLAGLAVPDSVPTELRERITGAYDPVDLTAELPAARAYQERRIVKYDAGDPKLDEGVREFLGALASSGIVALPIVHEGQVFGSAVVTMADHTRPFAEWRSLLETALAHLGPLGKVAWMRRRLDQSKLALQALQTAVQNLPWGVKVLAPDWTIQSVNRALESMLDFPAEELTARSAWHTLSELSPGLRTEITNATMEGGWQGELTEQARDGSEVPVQVLTLPVRWNDELTGVVVLERDLRDEKRAELARVRAYRLESVGELAAGVAHEVNNPLQAIAGLAELMIAEHDEPPEELALIRSEAVRAGTIVRNLLAFARPTETNGEPVDVTQLTTEVVDLVRDQAKIAGTAFEVNLDPSLPLVLADRDSLKQILHNLISNARYAAQQADGPGCVRLGAEQEGEMLALWVEDTGAGLTAEVEKRLFTPFFTTKGEGEGTGLGLAISRTLVEGDGGSLEAGNWGCPAVEGGAPGEGGARFVCRLPVAEEAPEAASPTAPTSPAPADLAGRAVVIDDEPAVAVVLEGALSRLGYEVEVYHRAEDALEHITSDPPVRLIVSDLRMPGMGGEGLYRELERRAKPLLSRLIFTSGDIVSETAQGFLAETGRPVLEKPFELDELTEMLSGSE